MRQKSDLDECLHNECDHKCEIYPYTKGPWRMLANQKGQQVVTDTLSDYRESICIVANYNEANARLISAAPEMLEILKQVQLLISGSRFHDESERSKVWSLVDSAINKAIRGNK